MAKYRVTGPDGATYNVEGPDGATDDQVLSQVKAYSGAGAAPTAVGAPASPAPAATPSAPAVKPPPPLSSGGKGRGGVSMSSPESDLDFISGNLNKGVAGLAGLPVDTVRNTMNLGIAGYGTMMGPTSRGGPGGAGNLPPLIEPGPGSSQWFENLLRRGGMIGQSAEPQSAGGRYGASLLQMLPSAMMGRPNLAQAPRAVRAAAASGLAGEAASDLGGEEWRGVGTMLPGARAMQHKGAGERATEGRQAEAFGKAREMGIPVPPSSLKPDKAQQAVQNAGNKALRQPEGTEFSPETLQAYRNAHYADYEAVMKHPSLAKGVIPTPAFQKELQTIGNEIESARATLPETFKDMRPVIKLLSEYGYAKMPQGVQAGGINVPPRAQPIPPEVAMRAIKKLRNDASTNFSSDKPEKVELARVQKRLANSIETMIEENLAKTGDQGLMQTFRGARTSIAKSHDYQAAMEPGGKINAAKLAAKENEGSPLSGGTKDIAQVAGAFPAAVRGQKPDEMFTHKVSPMAMTHPPAIAAHQIPRLWDRLQMNPAGQAMIDPRGQLTPQQQQLLRYLSAATSSNRGIPTPP